MLRPDDGVVRNLCCGGHSRQTAYCRPAHIIMTRSRLLYHFPVEVSWKLPVEVRLPLLAAPQKYQQPRANVANATNDYGSESLEK